LSSIRVYKTVREGLTKIAAKARIYAV